jgi:hypothetical protein
MEIAMFCTKNVLKLLDSPWIMLKGLRKGWEMPKGYQIACVFLKAIGKPLGNAQIKLIPPLANLPIGWV